MPGSRHSSDTDVSRCAIFADWASLTMRIARWHVESDAFDRALALVVEAQAALPMAAFLGHRGGPPPATASSSCWRLCPPGRNRGPEPRRPRGRPAALDGVVLGDPGLRPGGPRHGLPADAARLRAGL